MFFSTVRVRCCNRGWRRGILVHTFGEGYEDRGRGERARIGSRRVRRRAAGRSPQLGAGRGCRRPAPPRGACARGGVAPLRRTRPPHRRRRRGDGPGADPPRTAVHHLARQGTGPYRPPPADVAGGRDRVRRRGHRLRPHPPHRGCGDGPADGRGPGWPAGPRRRRCPAGPARAADLAGGLAAPDRSGGVAGRGTGPAAAAPVPGPGRLRRPRLPRGGTAPRGDRVPAGRARRRPRPHLDRRRHPHRRPAHR